MDLTKAEYIANEPKIGRLVKNAFHEDEAVTLTERHWKHFDWLQKQGVDVDSWTAELDVLRHSHEGYIVSLSGYLEMSLVNSEQRRFREGEDMPLFINPDGYLPDKTPLAHEKEILKEVVDASGVTVKLKLPSGCWQYLNWLENQGIDVASYIVDADRQRMEPKWKGYTLRGMLQLLLFEDEKKRYFSDEPSPLYICPEGYEE